MKTNNLVHQVMQVMMPVGYVFQWAPVEGDGLDLSTADKVRAYFGFGTWEAVSSGRALMGADDTHAAGSTAEAGLPNITGTVNVCYAVYNSTANEQIRNYPTGAFYMGNFSGNAAGGAGNMFAPGGIDASRSNSIYGASDTVQPPSYYVYIWKRIA